MSDNSSKKFPNGIKMLQSPILPLVRIVQLLYLTGPFENVDPVLDELNEPVETEVVTYENPGELLRPYLHILKTFEQLKHPTEHPFIILNDQLEPLDQFESIELWVAQNIMVLELEQINSLLCGQCNCTLCCIGPDESMSQEFFEIPLTEDETKHFPLKKIDTEQTRQQSSLTEPPLSRNDKPFYETDTALYHWQAGWGLILPKGSTCPNLDKNGGCEIYPQRPNVCRRPQIFSYVIERLPDQDVETGGQIKKAYLGQRKILAIWDCPYVKELKQDIATYAELCDMEPVFKKNKE